jgi:hypothetical protein
MPPKKDLESYKDNIIARFQNGETTDSISSSLGVTGRTIQRRLQD